MRSCEPNGFGASEPGSTGLITGGLASQFPVLTYLTSCSQPITITTTTTTTTTTRQAST
jgi:hypothetical protein